MCYEKKKKLFRFIEFQVPPVVVLAGSEQMISQTVPGSKLDIPHPRAQRTNGLNVSESLKLLENQHFS